ncbi:embryogenesis-associated protein EMB8 isoform X2 [Spinacia oleracea]|uniref:Embryogenesis-associated protein EMB8 isoform X2 n=1 Tax=Spinacia oleracea TaxID=3562 RepID=A0A9R0JWN5_SPIOL|nr:embryogenesis-associated protein EMB8 isoform X2 [Spinacia oleracea]
MTPIPEFLIPISRVVEYIIQFPLFITIMDDLSPILNPDSNSPYQLILRALLMIPISHYLIGFAISVAVFLYNFLELHLIRDILTGFRGQPITLTFNSESKFYEGVVSKCRVLHGRYLATPWLASPHLQTTFLNFFGRAPVFNYKRQIFHLSDGGTIALDWLMSSDVKGSAVYVDNVIPENDRTPTILVVPGLTSDSDSPSDCFYNAGWTDDLRVVIHHLHSKYPNSPLFVVGTSIGANVLVKFLGEDGEDIPIAGAVAICSPWDLLIGARFIGRKLVQKLYDRALTVGLQGYAQLHQPRYSRLANWEGIIKSRSIRDFDTHATCVVGKYETVDTYYRRCSSTSYVDKVAVPLLCISALDDPVCTTEAIPWDECRFNKNIVLATPQHGGHLAFFEGITASSLWWVRAVTEFLGVLHSSPYMHRQKKVQKPGLVLPPEPSIDQGPYVNVSAQGGMVAAVVNEPTGTDEFEDSSELNKPTSEMAEDPVQQPRESDVRSDSQTNVQVSSTCDSPCHSATSLFKRRLEQLSRHSRKSIWLLAYVAIVTSWPLLGSALSFFFKRKIKNISPARLQKK